MGSRTSKNCCLLICRIWRKERSIIRRFSNLQTNLTCTHGHNPSEIVSKGDPREAFSQWNWSKWSQLKSSTFPEKDSLASVQTRDLHSKRDSKCPEKTNKQKMRHQYLCCWIGECRSTVWGSQPKWNPRHWVWNALVLNSDPPCWLVRAAEGTCNPILPARSGISLLEGRWMMTLFSDPFQDSDKSSFLKCQFHLIKFTQSRCPTRQNYKLIFPNTYFVRLILFILAGERH